MSPPRRTALAARAGVDTAPAGATRSDLMLGLIAPLAGITLALLAALLIDVAPRPVLLVVLLPVQLLLAAGWLTLASVPARAGGALVAAGAALGADLLLGLAHRPGLGALAGVVGLGVVAAVLGQLLRRERSRVTDVLAAQCSAVVLVVATAPPLALAVVHRGPRIAAAGFVAIALCLLAGEIGARVAPGRAQGARAVTGLVLGGVAAAGVGALVAGGTGAVAAAVATAATVLAELVVGVVAGDRRVGRPLAALLPFALAAPAVFVVGRVMFG
jgi:hypothetical protein